LNPWPTVDQARQFLATGTGRGIRIAVLDSGIETGHPALAGLQLRDDLAIVDDGLQLQAVPGAGTDLYGHGTAIASLLRSLAPEADIGSFRVLGPQLRSRTALICEGARQSLDRGYHILHCSFGCSRPDQVLAYKDWIDQAYLDGRHIVAACNNDDFLKREWPGHFPTVITVNFTSTPRPDTLYFRPGHLVEFIARGEHLDVPWSGGQRKQVSGSSFAVAHAAGLLARLLSHAPALPPLVAKSLLQQSAEPWTGR
jgi:subtilisin family serine protease